MLGEIHVLAILRDPVKRAISNWRFSTDNGLETRSLETALSENLAGPREWDPSRTSVSPFAYLERGRYVDYLDPWMSTFPETSHVLFLEELLADGRLPDGLWTALGVAPGPRSARPGPCREPEPGSAAGVERRDLGHTGGVLRGEQPSLERTSRTGTALVNEAYRGARRDGRE